MGTVHGVVNEAPRMVMAKLSSKVPGMMEL